MTGRAGVVDDRIAELALVLHGPARVKRSLLAEARHGLEDAVAAHRAGGLGSIDAQRRAVCEFGPAATLLYLILGRNGRHRRPSQRIGAALGVLGIVGMLLCCSAAVAMNLLALGGVCAPHRPTSTVGVHAVSRPARSAELTRSPATGKNIRWHDLSCGRHTAVACSPCRTTPT